MRLNANFQERVVIRPEDHDWVPSPMPGVTRMMLDRIGDEVARATSFVRYVPNSDFPAHQHGGGEEILVLAGEFADEHGRYPAGTYLRNPVGTRHAPSVGPAGSEILVKLHQFEADDQRHFALDTRAGAWLPGTVPGLAVLPLHRYGEERVSLVRWPASLSLAPRRFSGGAEILVLEGSFNDGDGTYPAKTWLRLPPGDRLAAHSGPEGCLVYLKTGHLGTVGADAPVAP